MVQLMYMVKEYKSLLSSSLKTNLGELEIKCQGSGLVVVSYKALKDLIGPLTSQGELLKTHRGNDQRCGANQAA